MTCVPCLALSPHANRDERGRRGRLGGRPFGKMLGCEILVDSVIAANPGFIDAALSDSSDTVTVYCPQKDLLAY